jgi:hypothetical protein
VDAASNAAVLQHDGEAELIPLLPLLAETIAVKGRPMYLQSLN